MMALWWRQLAEYIVCLRKTNYDPATPPNVTQHYRAILKHCKLYMLVWAWQW